MENLGSAGYIALLGVYSSLVNKVFILLATTYMELNILYTYHNLAFKT